MANQLYWEGVRPVVIVTDEPQKYPASVSWPKGTTVHHRKELELVQKELQQVKGVSALIYDQTCAAEKRRRRKRNKFPNPPKRVFINQDVCEGCGDCNKKSNCVSVQPLDTEFGRKRKIDQSNCNKDFSCLDGFCPSFVSVHGGGPRKGEADKSIDELDHLFEHMPQPVTLPLTDAYNVLITGIGGTGVLTVGSILGMAAHLDDKASSVMDITGMAQKGGAVVTHLRIGASKDKLFATRLWEESADLVIGCDLVVTTGQATLDLVRGDTAQIVVNDDVVPTAQFQSNQGIDLSQGRLINILVQRVGRDRVSSVPATSSAVRLLGDSIATNVFMLGYAVQKGFMPISLAAIEQAIRLNGVAIEANLHALNWGRLAAQDPARLTATLAQAGGAGTGEEPVSETLEQLLARRVRHLTDYQDAAYARSYIDFLQKVREQENAKVPGSTAVAQAVAISLSKLMSYKDEYEVARLYSNGDFERRLKQQFAGDYTLKVHLSPPIFNPHDKLTGKPRKIAFGPWMLKAFRLLSRLKRLRGTRLDVFGYTAERRTERRLIEDYRKTIEGILPVLNLENQALVASIAALPDMIRGYGHVKQESLENYEKELAKLLASFDSVKLAKIA
jgi:indolepyruvate ferredoxin oxidoreductase